MKGFLAALAGTVVTTDFGNFLVGGAAGDDLTTDATLVGLAGMGGNDTLRGGAGADILIGDYFSADLFSDNTTGPPFYDMTIVGDDKLYGGAGGDTLVGGPGNDTLSGGNGNDFYALLGVGHVTMVELADGGIDTVSTSAITHTLAKYFENLQFDNLAGDFRKAAHGIGNAAANWLNGGLGADTLEGLGGNDRLSGGMGGKDLLIGGAGRDSFEFGIGINFSGIGVSIGANADTVQDFTAGQDVITLNPYTFGVGFRHPVADGTLRAAQFGVVGGVLTGKEAVLYDPATGDLSTTANGYLAPHDIGVFAHVTPGLTLTFHDFDWFNG